jgi:hypothetical protein
VADYQWWENMLKNMFFKQQRRRRNGDRAAQREKKSKKDSSPTPKWGKNGEKGEEGAAAQQGLPLDSELLPATSGLRPQHC